MCGDRANSFVFVDSLYSQSRLAVESLRLLEDIKEDLHQALNASCYDTFLNLFCHLLFPDCLTVTIGPCNYTYPAPLCSRECSMRFGHNRSCSSNYEDALALVEAYFAQNSISPVQMIFKAPSCNEIPNKRDSRCMMIKNLPNSLTEAETNTGDKNFIVTAFVPATISGLLIVAILVALWRKKYVVWRRRAPKTHEPIELELQTSANKLWDSEMVTKIGNFRVCPKRLIVENDIGEGTSKSRDNHTMHL